VIETMNRNAGASANGPVCVFVGVPPCVQHKQPVGERCTSDLAWELVPIGCSKVTHDPMRTVSIGDLSVHCEQDDGSAKTWFIGEGIEGHVTVHHDGLS